MRTKIILHGIKVKRNIDRKKDLIESCNITTAWKR